MTAIIGVLNKSAVAIAADSAVSVGSGRKQKVYNYANKIFNLNPGKPIAIMVFNNADLLGIPWETVIKEYRESVASCRTVDLYKKKFLKYLITFLKKYADFDEKQTIQEITVHALQIIEDDLKRLEDYENGIDWKSLNIDQTLELYKDSLIGILKNHIGMLKKSEYLDGFDNSDIQKLSEEHKNQISTIANSFLEIYSLEKNKQILKLIHELVMQSCVKDVFIESWTGLAFSGFGDEEIFPAMHSSKVGGMLNGKLRMKQDESSSIIDNDNNSAIIPFAQTDIIQTFIEGIDPFVKHSIPAMFYHSLEEFRDAVLEGIDKSNDSEKSMEKALNRSIKEVVNYLVEELEDLRYENHIGPMLNTIATLSKEDMAEMAESLINLTYLKRRVTFDQESVGGPVDVAVITKGDGFIWIKRKHYFKPELNLQYLSQKKLS
ncbi:MAG: hypothetical protein RLO81_00685 [Fulvivirga sp.]|uniref:hypothetical protein n=1 Tax=Fulvivirga sp. TaxID=1931237 RepID=UPI0032EBAFC7